MIRGMRTNAEFERKYAVAMPTMFDSRLHELIAEFEYGHIVNLCRAELRRRASMEAAS